MTGSLRGLGYSVPAALADIIDNSVSAGASQVAIDFVSDGDRSCVSIRDDGRGMTDPELEQAMRLGARDPSDVRRKDDLGRFGLGMKTASFSHALRLTVASRAAGSPVACLRWDLAELARAIEDDWHLLEGPAPGSEDRLAPLDGMASGTIVLWEDLDRIITPGFTHDHMIELVDQVDLHLGMTFHRLLSSADRPLEILLNGRPVQPWDPFMKGHPGKAWESVEYRLQGAEEIIVQCHVLPHKDQLSPAQHAAAAGPAGWVMQQGFYIYRNRRLLVPGGWLRMNDRGRVWTQDESHRLARIRLDIPNSADADWNIDVLKSSARPPVHLRSQLQRLAAETRERAREVFAHRGQPTRDGGGASLPDLWSARRTAAGTHYVIDRSHDLVASVLGKAGPLEREIEALLRLAEQTVPVQRIWLDTAEDRETPLTGFSDTPEAQILETLQVLFETFVENQNLSPEEARERLARTRPFDRFPALVARLG